MTSGTVLIFDTELVLKHVGRKHDLRVRTSIGFLYIKVRFASTGGLTEIFIVEKSVSSCVSLNLQYIGGIQN